MSLNKNNKKELNCSQSSFNLPDMTLPENFFSNFEEITNKYDNQKKSNKNNQQNKNQNNAKNLNLE